MTEHNRLHHRSVIAAAVTATFMMFVFGAAHRTLTARLANPEGLSSMSPDALEKLPLQIGDWTGREEPIDEAIIEIADTDAYVNREYSRYGALEQLWLYIAAGKRARDLMPHRPEVCYTGAGWTRINNYSTELMLDGGIVLPYSVFQFSKGVLITKKIIVLDYYIVDGQFCRDVSLLRSKIWRGSGTVGYVAQVQIVADITANRTAESALKMATNFAHESAMSIFQVLEGVIDSEGTEQLPADDYTGSYAGD